MGYAMNNRTFLNCKTNEKFNKDIDTKWDLVFLYAHEYPKFWDTFTLKTNLNKPEWAILEKYGIETASRYIILDDNKTEYGDNYFGINMSPEDFVKFEDQFGPRVKNNPVNPLGYDIYRESNPESLVSSFYLTL